MSRLMSLLIGVPLAILLVLFIVANRAPVTLSLDPFAADNPALAFQLPLFLVIFIALMLGVLVGGIADWLRQGRWRREARARRAEVARLEAEKAAATPQTTGLPALRR